MAAPAAFGGVNPMLPPDVQLQQINLQRQQALADALRQQALESQPNEVVAGRVVPRGLGEGLSRLGQAYFASKMQGNVNQGVVKMNSQLMQALTGGRTQQAAPTTGTDGTPIAGTYKAPDGTSVGDTGYSSVPVNQPTAQAGTPGPADPETLQRGAIIQMFGGDPAANAYWDRYKATDATRMADAAHVDPRQANADALSKANYIAPTRLGEGAYNDPKLGVQGLPSAAPAGYINQKDGQGNWQTVPVTGGLDANRESASQISLGHAAATPYSGVDAQGNPLPVTSVQQVLTPKVPVLSKTPAGFPSVSGSGQKGADTERIAIIKSEMALPENQNPASQANLQKQLDQTPGSAVYAAPPMGATEANKGTVDTVNKHWEGLNAAANSAPNQISVLQTIKSLAPKAITGGEADKRAYINGLLALGGIGAAPDLATATDLLKKNSAMLAANMRLGAGGGGTDALQTLAEAMNPNTHMQPAAIQHAADQIIGQVKMGQQLQTILQPYKLKNDVNGYQETLTKFNNVADPRIYQMQDMSPTDAQKFAKAQPDYASLKNKYLQGEQMGWWK